MSVKPQKYGLLGEEDVLALLKAEIAKAGSQTEWARLHGVDRASVCSAVNGQKQVQPKLIRALGLTKIVGYARY